MMKKYILFLPKNSVQTKENESRDVIHDVDAVLFHELACRDPYTQTTLSF